MKEFLMAAALAATSFDVETTIRVQQRCATCYEANPFMRSFAESRRTLYPAALASTASGAYVSWELEKRKKKAWWVPLAALTATHVIAGMHNRRLQ